MAEFTIDRTTPTVYIDKSGKPVQGYLIQLTLLEFDEVHELRVPSLTKSVVEKAAKDLLAQRRALAELE